MTETKVRATHIEDVRAIMLEQLRALRAAPSDKLDAEVNRAAAIAKLAGVLVDTARVEVEFLKLDGTHSGSVFLGTEPTPKTQSDPSTHIASVWATHTHRIRG